MRGKTLYGPRAIGTSAYAPTLSEWPGGGVVGLHGTDQPALIPGRPSHGCIRLRSRDILRLYRLAPTGTPIDVLRTARRTWTTVRPELGTAQPLSRVTRRW